MPLHYLSLCTVPITTYSATERPLETGTCFFYREIDGAVWLITNWHIVTNRNPTAPSHSKTGAIPTYAKILLHKRQDGASIRLSEKLSYSFPINDADGEAPLWLEHPHYRHKFDVVALPFGVDKTPLKDSAYQVLSSFSGFQKGFIPEVMMDAFIAGYPWGLDGGDRVLPIYKRGSIATEPLVNYGDLPRFLIDARTAPGMSGSPVFVSHSGIWSPGGLDDSVIGTVTAFAGVYSGRLESQISGGDSDPRTSDLGIVWKAEGIDPILHRGVPGSRISELLRSNESTDPSFADG